MMRSELFGQPGHPLPPSCIASPIIGYDSWLNRVSVTASMLYNQLYISNQNPYMDPASECGMTSRGDAFVVRSLTRIPHRSAG